MAKGQAKSNKEVRKPKKEAPKKVIQANPSTKWISLHCRLVCRWFRRGDEIDRRRTRL